MNDTKIENEICLRDGGYHTSISISRNRVVLRVPDEELDVIQSPSIDMVIGLVTEDMGFPLFNDCGYMYEEGELREDLLKMGLK